MPKKLCAAVLALLAAACGAPQTRAPAPATSPVPAPTVAAAAYRIDASQSELRVLVYRAGAMASFGHNHVIVNRALQGSASYAGDLSTAAFAFSVPVGSFVVDEAEARREEGIDFAEETPEDAKSGTLHNMLSPALLNAADYPSVTVRSLKITGSAGAAEATVALNVAGHESNLVVPFVLEVSPGVLRAHGGVSVRQSALGLTPYSLFLGALRVQDEITLKFKLVAVKG
jgi:polyisoprenoid-binding protein YceI